MSLTYARTRVRGGRHAIVRHNDNTLEVVPAAPGNLKVNDLVLAKVAGGLDMMRILEIDHQAKRARLDDGGETVRVTFLRIYGVVTAINGRATPALEGMILRAIDKTGTRLQEGDQVIRREGSEPSYWVVQKIQPDGRLTLKPEFDPEGEEETDVLASSVEFHHRKSLPIGTPYG